LLGGFAVEITTIPKTMTAEDLISLPDDGVEREIYHGVVRERPMTLRNHMHSAVEANIVYLLITWLKANPNIGGRVHSGEAGFRLKRNPDTFVGIDVAYVSRGHLATHDRSKSFYEGAPVLAVEILSPSDTHEDVVRKVKAYLAVGTVLWLVDPDLQTVTVYRPEEKQAILDLDEELSGEPYLPGFRVMLAAFFE
jgi:Uma2 family endonuclease